MVNINENYINYIQSIPKLALPMDNLAVADTGKTGHLLAGMQLDHTLELANLATATQADRTLVTLLMKKISELSGQVELLTSKLATAQAENAQIKIGTAINNNRAGTSGVQQHKPVGSKSILKPIFSKRTKV